VVTFEGSLDRMDATNLKAKPEEMETVMERQELHERFVARRCRGARTRTRDSVGSRQRLICSAVPAWRKGNIHKGPGRDSIGRGNLTVGTCGKKQRMRSEYNNGINCQGAKQQTR
jgi:hypothetical protein